MPPRIVIWLLAGLLAVAALGVAPSPSSALQPLDPMPDDLWALTERTWEHFEAAFPARWHCGPPVRVRGAWELADRATYQPDRRLVTVRIPATAAVLETALVHEFAHHLEFWCPEHHTFRPHLLQAAGLPPDTPWFAARWEESPSELYAEAAVEVTLGYRQLRRGTSVPREVVAVVDRWGRGDS